MSFLTGSRLELIEEYTRIKKIKGRFVIPIGPQQLYLKGVEYKLSKNGNPMIMITIGCKPEEVGENKLHFVPMTSYYVESRLYELTSFVLKAFNVRLEYNSIQELEGLISPLKGLTFDCIISHQKRMVMKDGLPAERKFLKNMDHWGLPIVIYEPKLWKIGTLDLQPEEHKLLLHDFNREEKEVFNMTLAKRYNQLYGTIDN